MRQQSTFFLATIGALSLVACEQVDDNGVPESMAITISETPVGHGDVVQVSDYDFSFDIQYKKDLIVSFANEDGTVTYEDQMVEGDRKESNTVSLNSESHLTHVTITRAKNGEEVFSFVVSGPYRQEEAEEELDDMGSSFSADIVTIVQSEGVDGLLTLSDLFLGASVNANEPFQFDNRQQKLWGNVPVKQAVKQKAADFRALFDVVKSKQFQARAEDNLLDDMSGLITWNATSQEFELTDETLAHLEIRFPTEGSATNNAVFRLLDAYYAGETTDGTDDIVRFEADLAIDGTVVMSTDFSAYESATEMGYDGNLMLTPFNFSSIANVNTNTLEASMQESVTLNGDVILGTTVEAELVKEGEDFWIGEVVGTQQVRQMFLNATVDGEAAGAWDYESDPNDFITADMYMAEQKLGDIIFEMKDFGDGYQDWYPYLVLPNGEKVDVIAILEQEVEEIEDTIVAVIEDAFGA